MEKLDVKYRDVILGLQELKSYAEELFEPSKHDLQQLYNQFNGLAYLAEEIGIIDNLVDEVGSYIKNIVPRKHRCRPRMKRKIIRNDEYGNCTNLDLSDDSSEASEITIIWPAEYNFFNMN